LIPDSLPTEISITPLIQGSEFSNWKSLNDTIMGGSSRANCRSSDKGLFLEGNIIEEGGGFVSCRSPIFDKPFDLSKYSGLILDIGKKSIAIIDKEISKTKEVLWCGPLGLFEQSPFHVGTASVAKTLSKMTKNGKIISVAGGGDTVAAISQSNYVNDFTYISTAGGAFLEMIAGQKLPGIEVLRK